MSSSFKAFLEDFVTWISSKWILVLPYPKVMEVSSSASEMSNTIHTYTHACMHAYIREPKQF